MFLKITENQIVNEAPSSSSEDTSGNVNCDTPTQEASSHEMSAEHILSQYETAETKSMTFEQLQRFVLLQKVHVLTLQKKRLEYLNSVENGKNIAVDYIGFDEVLLNENQGTEDST